MECNILFLPFDVYNYHFFVIKNCIDIMIFILYNEGAVNKDTIRVRGHDFQRDELFRGSSRKICLEHWRGGGGQD